MRPKEKKMRLFWMGDEGNGRGILTPDGFEGPLSANAPSWSLHQIPRGQWRGSGLGSSSGASHWLYIL